MNAPDGLSIRPARAADREAVLRFSEHTFEWGDYLQFVWDSWLRERDGKLLVATISRQPVAVAHLVLVALGEGWLEGMRVDPAYRRRGIATAMLRRCLGEAKKLGAAVVRFATASTNVPVHRMAATLGIARIAVLSAFQAGAVERGPVLSRPAPRDAGRLFAFLKNSAVLAAMGGLCNSGWRFQELTLRVIEERLRQGMLRILEGDQGIAALAITAPPYYNKEFIVSFVDALPHALPDLLQGLRAEAAAFAPPEVTAWAPEAVPLQMAFAQAGFTRYGESMWLFRVKT